MAQERIKINGIEIYQPDSGLQHSFDTTYSDDTARVQSGVLHLTPLFTVEQETYTATNIPAREAIKILQQIIKGEQFTLHYYSLFYAKWRDDTFYVGKGQYTIGELTEGNEYLESLTFNMTGVNPI